MTDNIAIVTDSISCLPKELIERYRIEIVPIRLSFKGKIYQDLVDLTPSQAYEMLRQDPEKFTTSPSSPGHYLDIFRLAGKRANSIVCITLSSKLSTGFNNACLAKEQAKTEIPGITIHVMDSKSVTAAEGFIVLAAAKAAANGDDLKKVIKAAEEVQGKVYFYAVLDTIKYVYRTGRVPKIASQVGSLLNIKPMLTSSDGLIKFKGIVKNKERGKLKLIEILREHIDSRPAHVSIMHADAPDEAEEYKNIISSRFNCAELWISEFTPVMGYATGTGTIALAFYSD
jgi:DegV family protein with EDD domain